MDVLYARNLFAADSWQVVDVTQEVDAYASFILSPRYFWTFCLLCNFLKHTVVIVRAAVVSGVRFYSGFFFFFLLLCYCSHHFWSSRVEVCPRVL